MPCSRWARTSARTVRSPRAPSCEASTRPVCSWPVLPRKSSSRFPTMTDVSIVVPTRNRADRLSALLASLAGQEGPPFEVIVVDNASSDRTLEVVGEADADLDAHVRAIHLPQPLGPAVARNRGWRSARAALVVFTDDDV